MVCKSEILIIIIIFVLFAGCVSESNTSVPITPIPTPQIFVPGQSSSDGLTKFTLDSAKYTYFNDSKYLIADVTVENISPNRSRSYGILWHFKVFDSDGYVYDPVFDDEKIITHPFRGSDMLPGDKRRGEIAFKIPDSANGLKLRFMWDPKNNKDTVTFTLSE